MENIVKKVKKEVSFKPNHLLFNITPLTIKLGFSYLKFKKRVQKAEKIFRNELKSQNLNQEIIDKFVRQYLESSRFIKNFTSSNFRIGEKMNF